MGLVFDLSDYMYTLFVVRNGISQKGDVEAVVRCFGETWGGDAARFGLGWDYT